MSDRIFGGLGLLFSVLYVWQASLVQDSFLSDVVGPRTFPYILAAGLAISSVAIILRPDISAQWPSAPKLFELAVTTVAMLLYAQVLPQIGFVIATTIMTAYLTWRLGASLVEAAVFGVAATAGLYVVFKLALGLSLASGPWGI